MTSDIKGFTVSADWLETHLNDPGIAVVDASWYLPAQKRDARAEYEAGHIPRAVFFDQFGRNFQMSDFCLICVSDNTFNKIRGRTCNICQSFTDQPARATFRRCDHAPCFAVFFNYFLSKLNKFFIKVHL